jgi:hypothetical protein
MKNLVKMFIVVSAVFAIVLPVSAGEVDSNKSPTDQDLELKYEDFEDFAKSKLQQLNRNHKHSRSQMQITKLENGTYRARYHQIDDSTMKVKVRRSKSNTSPYVGTISYREQVYESSASSPEEFDPDRFAVVEIIPNRHIFSYQKGGWD